MHCSGGSRHPSAEVGVGGGAVLVGGGGGWAFFRSKHKVTNLPLDITQWTDFVLDLLLILRAASNQIRL